MPRDFLYGLCRRKGDHKAPGGTKGQDVQGIYAIENKKLNRFYVGSSNDIPTRWKLHLNELEKNRHHSKRFQEDWNECGRNAFVFSVLEQVEILDDLPFREIHWIEKLNAKSQGYNTGNPASRIKSYFMDNLDEHTVAGERIFPGREFVVGKRKKKIIRVEKICRWSNSKYAVFTMSNLKSVGSREIRKLLKGIAI